MTRSTRDRFFRWVFFKGPFSELALGATPFEVNTLTWRPETAKIEKQQPDNLIRKNRFCYVYSWIRYNFGFLKCC
jgi:hypothetical protein